MVKLPQVELDLGPLEKEYRREFLRSDASQAIYVIGLSNLISLALIPADYQSFGPEREFFLFLSARLVILLISLVCMGVLIKSTDPTDHDRSLAVYMAAGAMINIFFNSMTSPGYVTYLGVSIVVLNIYYFGFHSPFHIRTTISILFSLIVTFQAYQSPTGGELGSTVLGMYLLTNILGASISARLHAYRRASYKAHVDGKKLESELNRQANTDPLTKTWNRRKFTESCIQEFNRAQRYAGPLVLMLIDIDQLKQINDTHGHLMGDEAIRHCASILKSQIREQDILGRLGGDEFGILLPETRLIEGAFVARRIQEATNNPNMALTGLPQLVTLSIGIAEWVETDDNFEDFFTRADKMLYRAKHGGRNRLVFEESQPDLQL
jgi:diguanylate cyclase (GGDEF)-like protein